MAATFVRYAHLRGYLRGYKSTLVEVVAKIASPTLPMRLIFVNSQRLHVLATKDERLFKIGDDYLFHQDYWEHIEWISEEEAKRRIFEMKV